MYRREMGGGTSPFLGSSENFKSDVPNVRNAAYIFKYFRLTLDNLEKPAILYIFCVIIYLQINKSEVDRYTPLTLYLQLDKTLSITT